MVHAVWNSKVKGNYRNMQIFCGVIGVISLISLISLIGLIGNRGIWGRDVGRVDVGRMGDGTLPVGMFPVWMFPVWTLFKASAAGYGVKMREYFWGLDILGVGCVLCF